MTVLALVYVDLDAVVLVINSQWHRVKVNGFPEPGEQLTTLCGHVAQVGFEIPADGVRRLLTPCPVCAERHARVFTGAAVPYAWPSATGPAHGALTGPPTPQLYPRLRHPQPKEITR